MVGQIRIPGATPVGQRVREWRTRAGLSLDALAAAARTPASRIHALECGATWVGGRGELVRLAAGLGTSGTDLAGLPANPTGAEHASIHACAHRLRRTVLKPGGLRPNRDSTLANGVVARLSAAELAGDELFLAAHIPEVIADSSGWEADAQARDARVLVRAVAAGLLRRLGWLDLSWIMLDGVRADGEQAWSARRLEQARLWADLGAYDLALVQAQAVFATAPTSAARLLEADIHARAGRPEQAAKVLEETRAAAISTADQLAVEVADLNTKAEDGDTSHLADLTTGFDLEQLPGAHRTAAGIGLAGLLARRGQYSSAIAVLEDVDRVAPWRLRLDPVARDLISWLAADEKATGSQALARRAGLV